MSDVKGNFPTEQKEAIQRMRAILAQNDYDPSASAAAAAVSKGWDKAWQEGITPWAVARYQPPLDYILSHRSLHLPKHGDALVPGCGRGDDVVLLAALGFDALGIDISPTAVNVAQQWLESLPDKPPTAKVELHNFFELEPPKDGFDLIYDYTFFVAFPPKVRPDWGASMTRLIRPGGHLITSVWPIDGDRADGPPFSVSVEDYRVALGPKWETVLDEVPPGLTETHVGRAKVVVWKSTK